MKTEKFEVSSIPVLSVEIAGIYNGGMAPMGSVRASLSDHMLLGAIVEGPDANWFFKLTGPRETVAGQRKAFREMLASLKSGT